MNTTEVVLWLVVGLMPSSLTWQREARHRRRLSLHALWRSLEVRVQAHRLCRLSIRLPLLELVGKPLWWLFQRLLTEHSR